MQDQLKQSVGTSEYQAARLLLVIGALSGGVLLVNQIATALQSSILSYYGVNDSASRMAQEIGVGWYELSVAQVISLAVATFGVIWFVGSERRRVARLHEHACECRDHHAAQQVGNLSRRQFVETMVLRSSLFSAVLMLCWLLQTSYLHYMAGFGWGIPYDDWTSLLPLASVFGVCVMVGLVVGGLSMFGLRLIYALELLLGQLRRRIARPFRARRTRMYEVARNIRDLFGYELLSRPPPAGVPA